MQLTLNMSDQKEVENLLKNLQLGLQKYSIRELNDAIVSVLNKKKANRPEINYVLQVVAEIHQTNTATLIFSKARGKFQDARMLAYCILHHTLGLSTRFIANKFHRTNNAVGRALKIYATMEPEKFKSHAEFMARYEKCQEKVLNYLNK